MLQRSPGKALSMTSPLARQRARVRKTGSLDVPEKTRFLSPTAVLDRRPEGARNGFETISVLGGSLPFSFSIPCGNLPRRFAIERTLDFGALRLGHGSSSGVEQRSAACARL